MRYTIEEFINILNITGRVKNFQKEMEEIKECAIVIVANTEKA